MTWTLTVLGIPVGRVDFVGVGFVSKGFVDWLGLDLNLLTKQQLQSLLADGDVIGCRVTFYPETLVAYRLPELGSQSSTIEASVLPYRRAPQEWSLTESCNPAKWTIGRCREDRA